MIQIILGPTKKKKVLLERFVLAYIGITLTNFLID
jgi:hypothetical protein